MVLERGDGDAKDQVYRPLPEVVLERIDQGFLEETISGEHFAKYFMANAEDGKIEEMIAARL